MDKTLKQMASDYGIMLDAQMLERFSAYARLLAEWNARMNLTAITDPEEVRIKHFLDSLTLLWAVEIPPGAAVIDVGTGAGFPGVPAKIVRGDIRLTLLDSLAKRIAFLEALSGELRLENTFIHARAEEAARDPALRESFDAATARAVAALPALCEYCLPFVKVGGVFVAFKGGEVEREAQQAAQAIGQLGGAIREIRSLTLPGENARSIVVIEKRSQTPPKYPRTSGKIAKAPL